MELSEAELGQFRDRHILSGEQEFLPNEGIFLLNKDKQDDAEMAIFDSKIGYLRPFHHDEGVWGILPRNRNNTSLWNYFWIRKFPLSP